MIFFMTIDIFVLKGDLNGENRSGAFLLLSGICSFVVFYFSCNLYACFFKNYILLIMKEK